MHRRGRRRTPFRLVTLAARRARGRPRPAPPRNAGSASARKSSSGGASSRAARSAAKAGRLVASSAEPPRTFVQSRFAELVVPAPELVEASAIRERASQVRRGWLGRQVHGGETPAPGSSRGHGALRESEGRRAAKSRFLAREAPRRAARRRRSIRSDCSSIVSFRRRQSDRCLPSAPYCVDGDDGRTHPSQRGALWNPDDSPSLPSF